MNSEYGLINSIITQGHIVSALKIIDKSYFKIDLNKQVYLFMVEFHSKYGKVPSAQIVMDKFSDFKYSEQVERAEFFIDELVESKCHKELLNTLSNSVDKLKTEKASDVLNYVSSELLDIRVAVKKDEDTDITKNASNRFDKYIQRAQLGKSEGIPCGLAEIDALTHGFYGGQVITIMAPAKTGKSFMSLFFAKSAWLKGYQPLYICLEMSAEQIAARFDAITCGLQHECIKHGKLDVMELQKYKEYLENLNQGRPPFIISTPSFCNQSIVRAKILEHQPDICIIDYVSLMQDEHGAKDWQAIDNIMRDIKNMARDQKINIPIIVIAQVNRGFETSGIELPKPENIAHGYSIIAHSDIVMAMHQNNDLREAGKMVFGIIAGRECPTLTTKLEWDMKLSIIREQTAA